jgi:hypothetical protein
MQFNNQPRKIKNNMTVLHLKKSIGRSSSRLALFLIPLVLVCFALSQAAQAKDHPTPTPTPTPPPTLADSGVPSTMREFIAPGVTTFTVPTGVVRILVEMWGAGGGGGDFFNPDCGTDGGTGGAGAYSRAILNVAGGDTVYVTVGQGGSAGIINGPDGEAGSPSSVRDGNTVITSGGGDGGGNAIDCRNTSGAQGSPGMPDPQAAIGRSSASRYDVSSGVFIAIPAQPEPGTVQPRGGFGGQGGQPPSTGPIAGANGYMFIQW